MMEFDVFCNSKTFISRVIKTIIILIIVVIAVLLVTVTIPSKDAPYYLILIFILYQIITGLNTKIKGIETYYNQILELEGIEGKLISINADNSMLFNLGFYYDGNCIMSDYDIKIEVSNISDDSKLIHLIGVTSNSIGQIVIVKEFNNEVYVFRKECELE